MTCEKIAKTKIRHVAKPWTQHQFEQAFFVLAIIGIKQFTKNQENQAKQPLIVFPRLQKVSQDQKICHLAKS